MRRTKTEERITGGGVGGEDGDWKRQKEKERILMTSFLFEAWIKPFLKLGLLDSSFIGI